MFESAEAVVAAATAARAAVVRRADLLAPLLADPSAAGPRAKREGVFAWCRHTLARRAGVGRSRGATVGLAPARADSRGVSGPRASR